MCGQHLLSPLSSCLPGTLIRFSPFPFSSLSLRRGILWLAPQIFSIIAFQAYEQGRESVPRLSLFLRARLSDPRGDVLPSSVTPSIFTVSLTSP